MDRAYAFQDFALAYFHPDWRLDDPDAVSVIMRFVRVSRDHEREAVVRDLAALIESPLDEQALHDSILRDYDLSYDPYSDEISMREWLIAARDLIASGEE